MTKNIRFLKTTAIGGLLFLLPLIVVGALIGQVVPIVLSVAEALGDVIPVKTPSGITLLIFLAILVILLLCFAAGLLARWSLGKRISENFEKYILLLFPRYAILKDQMADTIGGDETKPRMKPVVAKFDDSLRIGFEIERTDGGLVTVYLPGSPDPWLGSVVLLSADRVEPLDVDFGDAVTTFEQLGRNSATLLVGTSSSRKS
ncbi:MAG: DUF502 domain-containing protein [Pirellulales bacterium]